MRRATAHRRECIEIIAGVTGQRFTKKALGLLRQIRKLKTLLWPFELNEVLIQVDFVLMVLLDGETQEYYYLHGRPHRDEGPAAIVRKPDGSKSETYFWQGKRHREDGPAHIMYFSDGAVLREYYKHNIFQRRESNDLDTIAGVTVRHPVRDKPRPWSP